MTISQTTQELLKAHAGRGVSSDPALTARHKVRLLQNTSKLPKHGQGAPGLWILPDEAATCTSKLRVIAGACLFGLGRAHARTTSGSRALHLAVRGRKRRVWLASAQSKRDRHERRGSRAFSAASTPSSI